MQHDQLTTTEVLLVVDWDVDPAAVVAACRDHEATGRHHSVLVPARLPGMDWLGDPAASCPCATRQLDAVTRAAAAAGLDVTPVGVGEPEVVTAVADALAGQRVDEVVLCSTPKRARHPFDAVHRLRRSTGLPVRRVKAARRPDPERRGWFGFARGHCAVPEAQDMDAAGFEPATSRV